MLFLLDTNIVSEAWKPRPNAAVEEWMMEHSDECALSVITLAELDYGLHLLPFGKRRSRLERQIQFLREDFSDALLPFAAAEAAAWAQYAAEVTAERGKDFWTARTMRDSALAATARAWTLTVVTRDVDHFPFVEVLNPFK
jgi:predicted nucleic acid-binding protein